MVKVPAKKQPIKSPIRMASPEMAAWIEWFSSKDCCKQCDYSFGCQLSKKCVRLEEGEKYGTV